MMPPPGGMPPMGGMPPGLGLGPPPGQMNPADPVINPGVDPTLGPASMGGPEPDEATLEQLISILKVLGVGGAASGLPAGPGGTGLPLQALPGAGMQGGAGPNRPPSGRPGMMVPPMGGGPGMPGAPNPIIAALAGGGAGGV